MLPLRPLEDYGKEDKIIGSGTYASVYRYQTEDQAYAIKECKLDYIDIDTSIYREISTLRLLSSHPNIVTLIDVVTQEDSIFLILELGEKNLSQMGDLKSDQIRRYFYQAVLAIDYCHQHHIWHRDIKPSNFLLKKDKIILIDFGLAGFRLNEDQTHTDSINSLWYRPPEVLKHEKYSEKVDIWGLGCLFYELHYRKPLFKPLNSEDALQQIFSFLSSDPQQKDLSSSFWITTKSLSSFVGQASRSLAPHKETHNDVLKRLLELNPQNRPSTREILQDPYFDSIRNLFPSVERIQTRRNILTPNPEIDLNQRRAIFSDFFLLMMNKKISFQTWINGLLLFDDLVKLEKYRGYYTYLGFISIFIASKHFDVYPLNLINYTEEKLNLNLEYDIAKDLNWNFPFCHPHLPLNRLKVKGPADYLYLLTLSAYLLSTTPRETIYTDLLKKTDETVSQISLFTNEDGLMTYIVDSEKDNQIDLALFLSTNVLNEKINDQYFYPYKAEITYL